MRSVERKSESPSVPETTSNYDAVQPLVCDVRTTGNSELLLCRYRVEPTQTRFGVWCLKHLYGAIRCQVSDSLGDSLSSTDLILHQSGEMSNVSPSGSRDSALCCKELHRVCRRADMRSAGARTRTRTPLADADARTRTLAYGLSVSRCLSPRKVLSRLPQARSLAHSKHKRARVNLIRSTRALKLSERNQNPKPT